MNCNKDHLDPDDRLDRLLPLAVWPQTPKATMGRLREGYLAHCITAGRWRLRAALIATSIVLVVGTAFLMVDATSRPPEFATKRNAVVSKQQIASTVHVRDFTIRDRFLLMIADERPRETVVLSETPPAMDNSIVDSLSDPLVEARINAARRLGSMNDPDITHQLIELAQDDRYRREAVVALMHSRRQEARDFLAHARLSPDMSSLVRSLDVQISTDTRL